MTPQCRRLFVAVVVLVFAGSLAVVPAAAQTPPASLAGENLFAREAPFVGPSMEPPTGSVDFVFTCNPNGTTSFTYTTSGLAVGPYPGTYEESGSGSFGSFIPPQPGVPGTAGPVLEFQAQFTITSGTTIITGTKGLQATTPNSGFGSCLPDPPGEVRIAPIQIGLPVTYQATIRTPAGTFADSGTGRVSGQESRIGPDGTVLEGDPGTFNESFVLSNGVAPVPGDDGDDDDGDDDGDDDDKDKGDKGDKGDKKDKKDKDDGGRRRR